MTLQPWKIALLIFTISGCAEVAVKPKPRIYFSRPAIGGLRRCEKGNPLCDVIKYPDSDGWNCMSPDDMERLLGPADIGAPPL